jgi:Kef-type K+ transport system membrane component KefB
MLTASPALSPYFFLSSTGITTQPLLEILSVKARSSQLYIAAKNMTDAAGIGVLMPSPIAADLQLRSESALRSWLYPGAISQLPKAATRSS